MSPDDANGREVVGVFRTGPGGEPITVEGFGPRSAAGAFNRFLATWEAKGGGVTAAEVRFQDGSPQAVGTNGLTMEVLLAVVAFRLKQMQAGPFACHENGNAMSAVQNALALLALRVNRRSVAGVLGTTEPDPPVKAPEPSVVTVTDQSDPRLSQVRSDGQHLAYLVLSEADRAEGFVRPLRDSYMHVGGAGPKYPVRDLTADELARYASFGYVKYEEYPDGSPEAQESKTGRYWTEKMLAGAGRGCGVVTRMGSDIAATYARDPKFYGATYCVGCKKHLPVDAFVWMENGRETDLRLGS